jgi:hypothetical protein
MGPWYNRSAVTGRSGAVQSLLSVPVVFWEGAMLDWTSVYERLKARIESAGVTVHAERLGPHTTGVFDGLSITTNTDCDRATRCYNMAHSFGHIAQWSLRYAHFQALYEELNAAKANKQADPLALERALQRFRRYEEEASQYATWLLANSGNGGAIPTFTDFARADIEAIVGFHRAGVVPAWREFFAEWKAKAARGEVDATAFEPRPIPPFTPIHIPPQEVIQDP